MHPRLIMVVLPPWYPFVGLSLVDRLLVDRCHRIAAVELYRSGDRRAMGRS